MDVVGAFCTIADNLITFLHHLLHYLLSLYHLRPRNLTVQKTNYLGTEEQAHGLCNAMGHFRKERGSVCTAAIILLMARCKLIVF